MLTINNKKLQPSHATVMKFMVSGKQRLLHMHAGRRECAGRRGRAAFCNPSDQPSTWCHSPTCPCPLRCPLRRGRWLWSSSTPSRSSSSRACRARWRPSTWPRTSSTATRACALWRFWLSRRCATGAACRDLCWVRILALGMKGGAVFRLQASSDLQCVPQRP